MNIFLWIIFGALVGWIASILTHDNGRMGIISNIIIGLLGSVLGGFIASLLNIATVTTFSWAGLGFSILGAVILLFILGLFRGHKHR